MFRPELSLYHGITTPVSRCRAGIYAVAAAAFCLFSIGVDAAPKSVWDGLTNTILDNSTNNWHGNKTFLQRSDQAVFNDNFTGATSLTVANAGVQAAAYNFSHIGNTATNYVFTSAGSVGFADGQGAAAVTLEAGFLGSVDFNLQNTYTGGTTIDGGTLIVHSVASLGALSGGLTINAGTLEVANTFSTSRSITLGNSASTVQVDAGQTYTVTSVVGGLGALNKTGAGTLVLTAQNTFTGGANINGGTVVINSMGSLGSVLGTLTLNAGTIEVTNTFTTLRTITLGSTASTFQIDAGQTYTVGGVFSGTGTLNKTGAGTMLVTGVNTFTGGTNVVDGTLLLGGTNRLATTGSLTINGGIFDLQTYSQSANTVTLQNGTVQGSGTLTGSAFALQNGTVNAIMAGAAAVTKSTGGTVTLGAANTFTGATSVNAGTLEVKANGALGTIGAGTSVANGATLKLTGVNYSTAEGLTLNGTGAANRGALLNSGTSTFAGAITAATNATINAGGGVLNLTGGLAKNGTILTLTGGGTINITGRGITGALANSDLVIDNTHVVLSAASSYNGPTTVTNSGILELGANNVMPTTPQTDLTLTSSGVLDLAGHSDGVATLTGDSTAIVKNTTASTTGTLTVNPASGVSSTFSGVISGSGGGNVALVKSGAGALTLTGANTFSGSTTVSGGTLTVAAASGSALGSTTSVTVNSGGTLLLGASNQINNAATITLNGGTFSKGNFSEGTSAAAGMGALTLTAGGSHIDFGTGTVGTLTFASLSANTFSLVIDGWTGTPGVAGSASTDRLIFASDQAANLSYFQFTGWGGATEISLGNGFYEITPTAVPEPGTYVGGCLAAAAVFWLHRRAKAKERDPERLT